MISDLGGSFEGSGLVFSKALIATQWRGKKRLAKLLKTTDHKRQADRTKIEIVTLVYHPVKALPLLGGMLREH